MIIPGEMGDINTSVHPSYISFDPGDDVRPTTGITLWGASGEVLQTNEVSVKSLNLLLDWLEITQKPKCLIVEEYRLYQHKALQQSGSKLPPVQIIGMIKRSGHTMNVEVVEIRADAKSIAAAWSQTRIPSGHMDNWMASYLIGYYHLHKIGVIRAKVLEV